MNNPGKSKVICVLGMHLGKHHTWNHYHSNDLSIIPREYRTLYKNLKVITL